MWCIASCISAGPCSGGEFFGGLRHVGCGRHNLCDSNSSDGFLFLRFLFFRLLDARNLNLEHGALCRIGRHRFLAFHHLFDDLIVGKLLDDFFRAHVQRAERGEAGFE